MGREGCTIMRDQAGRVFSIAREHRPVAGCTTSVTAHEDDSIVVGYFALAPDTDISAESYPHPKLLLALDGCPTVYKSDAAPRPLVPGDAIVTPVDIPVGVRAQVGSVYAELYFGKDTTMNEAIQAGKAFKLADLLPYQDGTIVNMDVAHNAGMKLALMSFDAGTGLPEHAAPGEALIFALDGEAVIGYEGEEHTIHAGENFKFDRGGRHYVRAEGRFKMALLLTLE